MNWKRASIAGATALPVIGLLAFGLTRDPREIPSPLPGKKAPPFALRVFSPGEAPLDRPVGDTMRLQAFRGKVVVVNFWASWCLACRDEHEDLSRVAREYAGKDVQFTGILYQDAPVNGLRWIQEMGGQSYPSVEDPKTRTSISYGLYGVPETFFITKDGRVAFKSVGAVTAELLRAKIDSLLAQPAPAESTP